MATKSLTITEEAYVRLVGLKKSQESFSEEILRITQPCGKISEVAGLWKNMGKTQIEEMKEVIATSRTQSYQAVRKKLRLS